MEAKPPSASRMELSTAMGIQDANLAGFVHGGVIMRLVDSVAGLCAMKHAEGPVVTAAVDEMSFIEPVNLGDVVTLKASVNDAGRTSMEVGVRVETENVITGRRAHTSTAYLVFVAMDPETHRPRPVPPLRPETPDEIRRREEARLRREARLARRSKILEARGRAGEQ